MHLPVSCPVCGSEQISSAPPNQLRRQSSGEAVSELLMFRCGRGHVFLSEESKEGGTRGQPEARSSAEAPDQVGIMSTSARGVRGSQ